VLVHYGWKRHFLSLRRIILKFLLLSDYSVCFSQIYLSAIGFNQNTMVLPMAVMFLAELAEVNPQCFITARAQPT
jgi:hypothetical protein